MKEIFIERQSELLRIAIKNNGRLEECFIEEENNSPATTQIYKGIVKNIVPAIKCAFVDIGFSKNAYMYMDSKYNNTKLKKGDEVIVEVIKEAVSEKGPKVTNAITIPGRYTVLTTLGKDISFSKKISSNEFKALARGNLVKPENVGVMIRTNGENVDIATLNIEVEELYNTYVEVIRQGNITIKPKLLYSDEGVLDKILRDNLQSDVQSIIVNEEEDYKYIKRYIDKSVDINASIKLYGETRTLFDYEGIEKEILSLRNNRVTLKCGGYIIIEKTEAMYVVDVNSGKNVKSSSIDKTAFTTNLQAAEEIGRQIRLRNLSGIIVVDFIDMDVTTHKTKVLDKLKEAFNDDKNKTVIYPFTELSLVQIARRRSGKPIYEYIEETCILCAGKGKRLKLTYIESLIRNHVIMINNEQSIKDIYIEIDEAYKLQVLGDIVNFIKDIEALDKTVYINFTQNTEHFKVEPLIFANQIRNLQMYKVYG